MTREEVIEVIKAYRDKLTHSVSNQIDGDIEAFDMAIKALEEPMREFTEEEAKAYSKALDKMYKPTGFNVFNEPSGDVISRQAVMDCYKKWQPYMATRLWDFEQELSKLPSVNPKEPKTDRIEYGTDGNAYKLWISNGKEYEPSGDLISRAEAINALGYDISIESDEGFDKYKSVIKEMICKIYDVQKANIEKLPSVKQEPKTGHWINDEDTIGVYYCSKCGGYVASYDDAYCKYCGARMVEQERSDKE